MIVLKFGGSSLASVANFRNVLQVIQAAAKKEKIAVVVSAVGGVTNDLVSAADAAGKKDQKGYRKALDSIRKRHEVLAPKSFSAFLNEQLQSLENSLASIATIGECTPRSRDLIIGIGEILSAQRVSLALKGKIKTEVWDTREQIVTNNDFGEATVQFRPTNHHLQHAWSRVPKGVVPIITGFIGATVDDIPTTLGRNGSDYTASIVGAALGAKEIQIWTDVDGVLSADPRLVKEAYVLPRISYAEALEMAYFGAKVIHPKTMTPATDQKIPIVIKNTLNPKAAGTRITDKTDQPEKTVKAITAIPDLALVSLEGNGMIGVPGMASRLFGALAKNNVNVIMISQASSEHSICFVVEAKGAGPAKQAVEREFEKELERKEIEGVVIENDVAIVAAIGEGMRGTPGIAGRLFSVLGKNKVNILAIAQGSSEINISLVVKSTDVVRALNIIHGAFRLSIRHVHLVVIGKGTIGSKLLEQISENQNRLLKTLDLQLNVVGRADSKRIWFEGKSVKAGEGVLLKRLQQSRLENLIVVDATASEAVASLYPTFLKNGISVVTPNKKANTKSYIFYQELQEILRKRNSFYLYETAVGAGLPVISTLQDLIKSGDEVLEIQGIFSGTLSYLFSELEKGVSLAKVIRAAMKLGYTEPDPRDDLSGMDVARKILILARELGSALELKDVKVENLVPPALRKKTIEGFLNGLAKEDQSYRKKLAAAQKKDCALRYVAEFARGHCRVGIQSIKKTSPLARLRPGDNIVIFKTRRYFANPLIVQGPGAGPDVTAAGVFADILKVADLLT